MTKLPKNLHILSKNSTLTKKKMANKSMYFYRILRKCQALSIVDILCLKYNKIHFLPKEKTYYIRHTQKKF